MGKKSSGIPPFRRVKGRKFGEVPSLLQIRKRDAGCIEVIVFETESTASESEELGQPPHARYGEAILLCTANIGR